MLFRSQANLSLLIGNCGDTLKRLEAVLKVYEEKVVVKGKGTRGKVVREWNRVKWVVEEKGLADIRAKIVQQTEGIALVLNIFTWTEVRDGRNEAKEGTAKIEELLEKLFQHGTDAKQTAQDAEQMMKDLVARTMGGVTSDLKDMIISTIKLAVSPPPHPSPSPPPHGRGFQAFKMGSGMCRLLISPTRAVCRKRERELAPAERRTPKPSARQQCGSLRRISG